MSLLHQATSIVCGFILPRLILESFGSEVNGVVDSITQFLGVISFLELGVGAVVQSSLYKPLAENDSAAISRIMRSANRFFHKLALILLVYVVVLIFVYPYLVNNAFDYMYTASLVLIISISAFSQYYFGIANRLLLNADQKGYIQYITQIAAILLNTLMCVVLIGMDCSIHIVKLTTSTIYFLQPLALYLYVRKRYTIDKTITYTEEPIKQKWNGVAQHVSAVVLDGTDTIVLTLFSSLADVSIYSVYNLVVKGIKQLVHSMIGGVTALVGELWAKKEIEQVKSVFGWTQWVVHTVTTYAFSVTAVLIVPFVSVYTAGITDAEYSQPLFAVLITLANAGYCLRLPYSAMVLAAGHYKQTQSNYIVAVILNIVISVATVSVWGLVGVAIGTIVAMFYQTIWMAVYSFKHLLKMPLTSFVKQMCIDAVSMVGIYCAASWIPLAEKNYGAWLILAVETALIALVIVGVINIVFYKDKVFKLLKRHM